MQFMDVDQSWNLLRHKVFNDAYCPHELENIGRIIETSCRGLPLAIVVIAGILSTVSQTPTSWANVAENVKLSVSTNEEQFTNILSLSYNHLPHHLRSCFLYMGGFPEDYKIYVTKLIKLWTAEGFIKPSGSKSYEESAEEYLEDLVKRSLILVTERKSNGKIKSCNIHDLVRNLCISKAHEEKFIVTVSDLVELVNKIPTSNQRRVSIQNRVFISILNNYGSTICTILCFLPYQGMWHRCREFRLLKVLDAVDVELASEHFPTEVVELIFLRYLAFSFMDNYSGEINIPASISRLQNLQTLFICPYKKRFWYPSVRVRFHFQIWRMKQLRHLVLFTSDVQPDPCPRYSALENLQTLAKVMNFRCTEGILQTVPNLRKLGVNYYNKDIERSWSEYHLENLVHLHQLQKLNIRVDHSFRIPIRLWGNLDFPPSLRKLKLTGCELCSRYMQPIGSLPNLELLKLKYCDFEECWWETNEGEFSVLKFLQIHISNLQQWITETNHFPRLKRLMLWEFGNLAEIPDAIGEVATLELIEVYIHDKSLVESAKRIQEEQRNFGNDTLQVRVLKTIK